MEERFGHDAVYLPTVDKVLVVGGKEYDPVTRKWSSLNTAELYDVATGTFSSTASPMAYSRDRARVVWLGVTGGADALAEHGENSAEAWTQC